MFKTPAGYTYLNIRKIVEMHDDARQLSCAALRMSNTLII